VTLESEPPQSDPTESAAPGAHPTRYLPVGLSSWIVLLTIATAALALAAAHLPPVFKKLGLFAIAYGLLVGLIAAWLAPVSLRLHLSRRLGVVLVFVIALSGQIGIAAESYRVDREQRQRLRRADPNQALAQRLLESAAEPTDEKSRATFEDFRHSYGGPPGSFVDYLQFRLSSIGIQSKPVAISLWGVELLLGGVAASWVFARQTRSAADDRTRPAAELDTANGPAKLDE
jgi:hypothetical protein